jgi:hypothetical protein
MNKPVAFWKFNPKTAVTQEQAADYANSIAEGVIVPVNGECSRYHLSGGWAFDIGRKPYLIEAADGGIYRRWARNKSELRRALGLKRTERLIAIH